MTEISSSSLVFPSGETELVQSGENEQPVDNYTSIYTYIFLDQTGRTLILEIMLSSMICSLGFLGNGLVIWLFGFCIKRNPFTTSVLNLSVADLGYLITEWIMHNLVFLYNRKESVDYLVMDTAEFMYSASQYFLTVISVDRCVSVFFPIWYRSHRPKHLSAIVCALICAISFLPQSIGFMSYLHGTPKYHDVKDYHIIVNGFLCLPLMAISSLMLVSKVCSQLEQPNQRKLLIMILFNVLFFIIFSLPVNAAYISIYFFHTRIDIIHFFKVVGACLNSSINPIIYGLVGRPRKGSFMKNLKTMLQSLFSGEELSVQPRERKVWNATRIPPE